MSQKGKQEKVRMQSERWQLLGGNLLTSLSIPLALFPYSYITKGTAGKGAGAPSKRKSAEDSKENKESRGK